jgi:hypothetical protein
MSLARIRVTEMVILNSPAPAKRVRLQQRFLSFCKNPASARDSRRATPVDDSSPLRLVEELVVVISWETRGARGGGPDLRARAIRVADVPATIRVRSGNDLRKPHTRATLVIDPSCVALQLGCRPPSECSINQRPRRNAPDSQNAAPAPIQGRQATFAVV